MEYVNDLTRKKGGGTMLYEEAKRQTYEGLSLKDYQWLEQMYLDYAYLGQPHFWEAYKSLLKEMEVEDAYFFELCRKFGPIYSSVDSYFFFYPVLGRISRDLQAMKERVKKYELDVKYDFDDGMLAP